MLKENTFKALVCELIPNAYEYSYIQESDVAVYEQKIKQILPNDYRKFLLLTNGGHAYNHFVWSRDSFGKWWKNIPTTFLGLNSENRWSSLGELDVSGEHAPSGYLRIAYDPGGNPLFINLNKNHMPYPYGAIYIMDHEELVEEGNLQYVAPSFNSYLLLMEPYDADADSDISQIALSRVIMNDDAETLQEILNKKLWRIDEYYRNGNTLADDALLYGKLKVFKALVELGAKVPRFFKYAHNSLTEDEIVKYIKSGKM